MSKRFGRNQKRKLNKALQELEQLFDAQKHSASYQNERYQELKKMFFHMVEKIEQLVPYSICTPVNEIDVHIIAPSIEMIGYPYGPVMSILYKGEPIPTTVAIDKYRMFRIDVIVEENRESFGKALHVIAKDTNKRVAYYVSDQSLDDFGPMTNEVVHMMKEKWEHTYKCHLNRY